MSLGLFLPGFTQRSYTHRRPSPILSLSELLEAVKAGGLTQKIRTSLAWVLQQLIEAELTDTSGAGPHETRRLPVF